MRIRRVGLGRRAPSAAPATHPATRAAAASREVDFPRPHEPVHNALVAEHAPSPIFDAYTAIVGLKELGCIVIDDVDEISDFATILGSARQSGLLEAREASGEWSLSGKYGWSPFPWHTDGAVSLNPPRWILLRAVEMSAPSSTELHQPSSTAVARLKRTVLRVQDRRGSVRYLPALTSDAQGYERLRWDPRTCRPPTGGIGHVYR